MMKNMIGVVLLAFGLAAEADVLTVTDTPMLDGKLDETVWSAAKWEGGFQLFARPGVKNRTPAAQTEFALLADDENLYIGVRAHHPHMAEVKAMGERSAWQTEGVEFYFSPDGNTFEFYQYLITYQGLQYAMFHSENGNIRPDPYGPEWEMKSAEFDGGWTAEARIPLSAFYMTRDAAWKDDWKMNVGRSYVDKSGQKFSCWADGKGFKDLKSFRTVSGFPKRKASEDVWVRFAQPTVSGPKDGKLAGTVKLGVYAAEPGDVTVETAFSEPVRAKLGRLKVTEVEVPVLFPENGRLPMGIRIVRPDCTCARTYPVIVDYQPIRVKLASPGFRGNFYPGQNSDRVAGTVIAAVKGTVSVTLEGPGFGRKETRLGEGGGAFTFDTRGFQVGDATLTVVAGADTFVRKVRKLAPLDGGRHVSWVENGNLIVDGKPVFRRNMYAEYYLGGEAFKRKYDADDLHQTKWLQAIATLEPMRLIKGIEAKEAIRDVKPCPELFAKIDEVIDRNFATSKGSFYYICDEPECRQVSPVYLKHIYDYVSEKDPYHVLLTCSRSGEKYIDCADWFETHPYVNAHYNEKGERIYGRPFSEIGDFVSAFHPENHPDKCIGGTPTCFSYGGATGDHPTFEEYLANVWCELLRGAKTMYPYAYHDLGDRAAMYEGTRYIFASLEALEDILLLGTRTTLAKTPAYECALWTMPDGERMFAIQSFATKPQTVKVPGLSGLFREFRGERKFDLSSVQPSTFNLQPLESLVGTTKTRDGGLPTFAETKAKIDEIEAERLGRDNQLLCAYPASLGKNPEIEVVSSTHDLRKNKMFDGVRDVIAWYDNWGKNKFYEMSFPKFVPEFSEMTVYGRNIAKMVVKIREDGEWKTLEPTKVEADGYRLRYVFDRKHSTVKIRLEFPGKMVELYEIELPGNGRQVSAAFANAPLLKRKTDFWVKNIPAGTTGHVFLDVRREKGQKYLSFDFRKPRRVEEKKYTDWSLSLKNTGGRLARSVATPIPGLYTLRLPDYDGEPRNDKLMIHNYNLALEIGDIVCSREPPENRVEFVEAKGVWAVRVTLEKPCEDMTCKILQDRGYGPEAFSADGKTAFELRAVNPERTVWAATLPIPASGLVRNKKGELPLPFVKVTVLGGAIDTPLLTWIHRSTKREGDVER